MRLGRSPSAICGSPTSSCRSGSARPDGPTRLPVLVMVTGYARWLSARLIPSRAVEDLLAGWWALLQALGAVPRVLVWDGEGSGRAVAARPQRADRGHPGVPRHPGHQGGDLPSGRSGGQGPGRAGQRLPGDLVPARPQFSSPADFNAQLAAGWRLSTPASGGCWAAPRSSGSRPTGPRCWPCRRSRRPPGGGPRCGCRGTTTCAWTATTTRSTRPRSAAASRSPPTCERVTGGLRWAAGRRA